jgi:DNA-binding PadR family transcriptional regulator
MTIPEKMLPLTPAVFHILLALSDQERHGYGMMQEVARQTGGAVRLGPGTLYGSIKRMLAANLIEEVKADLQRPGNDDRRRYYRLTDFGRRVARLEANRLQNLVREARLKKLLPDTGTSLGNMR